MTKKKKSNQLDLQKQKRLEEINDTIKQIKLAWSGHPYQRFCQLLFNIVNPNQNCPEFFYTEDEKLKEQIKDWLSKYK